VERVSIAPAWSRVTSIIVIVPQIIQFNMFTYPPSPPILAGDNLVSDSQGFTSAMNSGTAVGKGEEEEEVTIADVLRRCDAILDLLRPVQPCKVVGSVSVVSNGDTRGAGSVLVVSNGDTRGAGSDVNAIGAIGGGGALAASGNIEAADGDGDRVLRAIGGSVGGIVLGVGSGAVLAADVDYVALQKNDGDNTYGGVGAWNLGALGSAVGGVLGATGGLDRSTVDAICGAGDKPGNDDPGSSGNGSGAGFCRIESCKHGGSG
jgi:hypothetical protein